MSDPSCVPESSAEYSPPLGESNTGWYLFMHGMINQSSRSNFQGCRLAVPSTFNFKFLWHHSQKFHPCLPQYHTKRVIVDISPQSSDYSTKFLQYRPWKVFTVGESKMTNVTFSNCITTYRAMTNTLLYAIKRMQHSCDLKIYLSEESAKNVQWQNVKSVELTPSYMTSEAT